MFFDAINVSFKLATAGLRAANIAQAYWGEVNKRSASLADLMTNAMQGFVSVEMIEVPKRAPLENVEAYTGLIYQGWLALQRKTI